jgi:hypothetical protein
MGGLRSFTRTRRSGETTSSSASRGNIGSRSCGRLRQTILRAKHQKRESDTKARCKGRGSPTRRRPYEYERPDDQPATTSGGPLEPESCCHVYSPRCHVGLLAAYRPTRSGQMPAPWLRSSARLRDRPWKLRGETGPFRSLARDWRCPDHRAVSSADLELLASIDDESYEAAAHESDDQVLYLAEYPR